MEKTTLGIIAVSLVALIGVSFVAAYGFGNGAMSGLTEEEKAELQEQRQDMRNAIENEDFAAWKSLMEEKVARIQGDINEENFAELVARHQEMSQFREQMQEAQGDPELMQQLREQYGFEDHRGFGKGKGMGLGMGECPMAE